jgi:hypothetical protein
MRISMGRQFEHLGTLLRRDSLIVPRAMLSVEF